MGVMIYNNFGHTYVCPLFTGAFCPRRGQKRSYKKMPKRLDGLSKNGYIIGVQRETDKPLSNP